MAPFVPLADANEPTCTQFQPEFTEWYRALPSVTQMSPSAFGLTTMAVSPQAFGAMACAPHIPLSPKLWPPSYEMYTLPGSLLHGAPPESNA